ncbi:aspartate aminotransferase family protein [Thermodesulfobacteriota bacterium]
MAESDIARGIVNAYEKRFPLSKEFHQKFLEVMPGGTTRSLSYFKPYPLHIEYGKGAYVYTHEGHKLLDVTNSYGALVLGHGDPDVADAIRASVITGIQFSAPTDTQYEMSKLLCERIPSFDKIRFCNSGTESTLFALRTARAYKKRNKILKMDGGFHGTHDCVSSSTQKDAAVLGIPKGMVEDVLSVPFNNFELLEEVLIQNRSDLACVIMEPFLGAGGVIPPKDGYLQFVRELTEKHDILLIYDEIFSYRIDTGGAQTFYGVVPDLTTVGKVIGGGLPVGVFGGKSNIMDIYCSVTTPKPLYHSGTFNGYETALRAGLATLQKYNAAEVSRLNALGELLHDKLKAGFVEIGISVEINQIGSLLNIHFHNEEIIDNESAMQSEGELLELLHLSLLNRGIYATPRALFILSTPMTEREIEILADTIIDILRELKPLIRDKYPRLIC